MKIASWNVNSVRARRDRLLAFLERHAPDVVCLQETKVVDEDFPREDLRAAGYHCTVVGQRTYNGVALLSREEPRDAHLGFGDGGESAQARIASAVVGGVRFASVYVPNGRSVGSEQLLLLNPRRPIEAKHIHRSGVCPVVVIG